MWLMCCLAALALALVLAVAIPLVRRQARHKVRDLERHYARQGQMCTRCIRTLDDIRCMHNAMGALADTARAVHVTVQHEGKVVRRTFRALQGTVARLHARAVIECGEGEGGSEESEETHEYEQDDAASIVSLAPSSLSAFSSCSSVSSTLTACDRGIAPYDPPYPPPASISLRSISPPPHPPTPVPTNHNNNDEPNLDYYFDRLATAVVQIGQYLEIADERRGRAADKLAAIAGFLECAADAVRDAHVSAEVQVQDQVQAQAQAQAQVQA
jgi:hypothetical protein